MNIRSEEHIRRWFSLSPQLRGLPSFVKQKRISLEPVASPATGYGHHVRLDLRIGADKVAKSTSFGRYELRFKWVFESVRDSDLC